MGRRYYLSFPGGPTPSESDYSDDSGSDWESDESYLSSESYASSSESASSSSSSSSSGAADSLQRPDRNAFEKSAEAVMQHTSLVSVDFVGSASGCDLQIPWYKQAGMAALDGPDGRHHGAIRKISSMVIRHGFNFPQLQIKFWDRDSTLVELDVLVNWLMEDLDDEFPLLGFDAESGKSSMRLIQLSTAKRCLLIRIPQFDLMKSNQGIALSAKFRALMSNGRVFKSGAEVWTDALDVWSHCARLATDGCLDMSLSFTTKDQHWSLSEMCHVAVGPDSFRKDKGATCSDWDAEVLSMRQLIYAALDAQASYMVAACAKRRGYSMPLELNLSTHIPAWLSKATEWRQLERLEEQENRKQVVVDYERVIRLHDSKNGADFLVKLLIYKSRIRLFSNVTIDWKDGSISNWMKVVKVDGKEAFIKFLGGGDARSQSRKVPDIKRITLNRADEMDIFNAPSHRYLSDYLHRQINFNPFIQQLLQLPMSAKDAEAFNSHPWQNQGIALNNNIFLSQHTFQELNDSQKQALIQSDSHRISRIQGRQFLNHFAS